MVSGEPAVSEKLLDVLVVLEANHRYRARHCALA